MPEKLTFTCTRCNGSGVVTEHRLRPFTRAVLTTIRGARNGIKALALVDQVYRTIGKKQPANPLISVQTAIRELNQRIKQRKRIVVINQKHTPFHTYRLVNDGDDHDNADHRPVHGSRPHGAAAHSAGPRQAE